MKTGTHDLESYVKNTINFIVILTPDLLDSQWCLKETMWAIKYKCNIITVLPQGTPFPDAAKAPEPFKEILNRTAIAWVPSLDNECMNRIYNHMHVFSHKETSKN